MAPLELPDDVVNMIYTAPVSLNRYVQGPQTKQTYLMSTGMIIIDMDKEDAAAFVAQGKGRYPSETELQTQSGLRARLVR